MREGLGIVKDLWVFLFSWETYDFAARDEWWAAAFPFLGEVAIEFGFEFDVDAGAGEVSFAQIVIGENGVWAMSPGAAIDGEGDAAAGMREAGIVMDGAHDSEAAGTGLENVTDLNVLDPVELHASSPNSAALRSEPS